MPRNPDKKRCRYPACRNWAMRGYDQCRPHLDPILGPRGAGAPRGNLNALKTGEHINPTGPVQLQRLAGQIARHPEAIQETIAAHVHELYTRVGYGSPTPRALRTIIALQRTMEQLIPHLANALFVEELEFLAQHCPPEKRAVYKDDIWSLLAHYSPQQRLLALVDYRRYMEETRDARRQLAEHSTPNSATSEKKRDAQNN